MCTIIMWSKEDCYYVSIAERSFARLLQVNPANIEIKLTLTLSLLQRKLIRKEKMSFNVCSQVFVFYRSQRREN